MAHTYNYRRELPPVPRTAVEDAEIMADILAVIPLISDKYTNRNPSDPGMVTIRGLVRACGNLHYYLNSRRLDVLLDSCVTRKSLFSIVRPTGYKPHLAAGAMGTIRVTLTAPASSGVVLPKWWQCRTPGTGTQSYMTLLDEAVIPAGQVTVYAYATEGRVYTMPVTGTGQLGQTFTLPRTKVSRVLLTVEGEDWTEVEDLVGEDPDAKVFAVRLAWDGTVTVETGDGVDGKILPEGAIGTITYIVTTGSSSNDVGIGSVTEAVDAVMDGVTDVTASTVVTNIDAPAGGEDEEADDDIKRHAPRMARTCGRCGPGNDWQTAFESHAGVERVQVVDLNNYDDPDDVRYNYITVYVIPAGGGTMTDALKAVLKADIVGKQRSPGMDVVIEPAERVVVDVAQTIYRRKSYSDAQAIAAVTAALEEYFDVDPDVGSVDWGEDVVPAQLIAISDECDEVSYAEGTAPATTVEVGDGQFPQLGELSLTVVEVTD